jgi:hypothetical protein
VVTREWDTVVGVEVSSRLGYGRKRHWLRSNPISLLASSAVPISALLAIRSTLWARQVDDWRPTRASCMAHAAPAWARRHLPNFASHSILARNVSVDTPATAGSCAGSSACAQSRNYEEYEQAMRINLCASFSFCS